MTSCIFGDLLGAWGICKLDCTPEFAAFVSYNKPLVIAYKLMESV